MLGTRYEHGDVILEKNKNVQTDGNVCNIVNEKNGHFKKDSLTSKKKSVQKLETSSYVIAKVMYEAAAMDGFAPAQNSLGLLYANLHVIEKLNDPQHIIQYYRPNSSC